MPPLPPTTRRWITLATLLLGLSWLVYLCLSPALANDRRAYLDDTRYYYRFSGAALGKGDWLWKEEFPPEHPNHKRIADLGGQVWVPPVPARLPYRDFPAEYPPLSFAIFLIPRLFTDSVETYHLIFSAFMSLFAAGLLYVGYQTSKTLGVVDPLWAVAAWTLWIACSGPLLVYRFDVAAVFFVGLGTLLFLKDRPLSAGIAIGAAISIKIWPLFLLLPLAGTLPPSRWKSALPLLAGAALLPLFTHAALMPWTGDKVLSYFAYHGQRGIHIESFWAPHIAPTPPTVTGVYVKGSAWTPAFLNYLATAGQGDVTLGYRIPTGAAQAQPVPFANVNQLTVTFSENVSISQAALALTGLNVSAYSASSFSYNPASRAATWTFPSDLHTDVLQIALPATGPVAVTDTSGNALDGEWTNNTSTASGNGTPGGDFALEFKVLPADANGNGTVDFGDFVTLANSFGQPNVGSADFNGDGAVSFSDFVILANNFGTTLPAPPAPAFISYFLVASAQETQVRDATTSKTAAAPVSKHAATPVSRTAKPRARPRAPAIRHPHKLAKPFNFILRAVLTYFQLAALHR